MSHASPIPLAQRIEHALAGKSLYGNDFSPAEIDQWFADESEGYFNLYFNPDRPDAAEAQPPTDSPYTYAALAQRHGFAHLGRTHYPQALGIGSANGAELRPVLQRSQQVTVLEPSDGFSATHIDGKPVTYVKPQASGHMPFADASFDLIVCFSVLHHIPNVSTVIQEMFRVLKPGGQVLLREPTHSMGDWRQPRRGLTRHERGLPLPLFRAMVRDAGFTVVKETRCMFSLLTRLEPLLRRPVWTVPWVVTLDTWLSRLPVWPRRYHATRFWHKIRPTAVAYVLSKPGAATR